MHRLQEKIFGIFLLVVLSVAAGTELMAQSNYGAIRGTVTDVQGGALTPASVVLTSQDKGTTRKTISNGSGEYVFNAVDPGTYTITVSMDGFQKSETRGITVDSGNTIPFDVTMMDLERVLPAGVQVASIEPTTSKTGEVTIRLRVIGDRERAVDLVRNLEKSQRFVSPRLAGESAQTQEGHGAQAPTAAGPAGVEFEIYSGYNPLTLHAPKPVKAASSGESATPASPQPGSPTPHIRHRSAPAPPQKGASR